MPDEVRAEAETLARARQRTFADWLRSDVGEALLRTQFTEALRVAFNAGFTACWVEHLTYTRGAGSDTEQPPTPNNGGPNPPQA